MRIVETTTVTAGNEKLATLLLRRIERLVCEHRSSVKDGWRTIILMRESELGILTPKTSPYFVLDTQSNQGGGDYAWTKMKMLIDNDTLPATGMESPKEFAKRIMDPAKLDEMNDTTASILGAIAANIRDLDYIEQISASNAERLKEHNLTSYKGAIRVPYEILVVESDNKHRQKFGEILIAFSGAEEWQDLLLSTYIFADMQRVLNNLWEHGQIWFNLRELQKHPQIEMLLKLLDVREA